MLLGLFRFQVARLCGLCCWVVLISGASILLLVCFSGFPLIGCVDCVAGFVLIPGCWIVLLGCVDSGCVDLVAGFVFLVLCRWVVWILV